MSRPRILVTNDDGIFSEGIERLSAALSEVGDVFTVAPDQERSAAGHSLTLHHPLRAKLIGPQRWSVDGTPTDCVNWGVLHLLKDDRPKLLSAGVAAVYTPKDFELAQIMADLADLAAAHRGS